MPEPLDFDAARDVWHRLAPASARALIDARALAERRSDEDKQIPALFFWDSGLLRFRRGDGRVVATDAVKTAVNKFSDAAELRMQALAAELVNDSIGRPEWTSRMNRQVVAAHLAAYAIGRGGIEQITGKAAAAADATLAYHVGRLDKFAEQIKAGQVSDAALVARSILYGVSLPGTFEESQYQAWDDLGVSVQARNILDDRAVHCTATPTAPSCQGETNRGWVDLDDITTPGSRACGPRCRCYLQFRQAAAPSR